MGIKFHLHFSVCILIYIVGFFVRILDVGCDSFVVVCSLVWFYYLIQKVK